MNPIQLKAFAETVQTKLADISPQLLGALLGGAGLGTLAYTQTDDPRKKLRNALLAGGAGALGGHFLGGKIGDTDSSLEGARAPVSALGALSGASRGMSAAQRLAEEELRQRAAGMATGQADMNVLRTLLAGTRAAQPG